MSITGYLDGVITVNAPPGITITSFQVYFYGGQIDALFQAAPDAPTGQHDVTVTTASGVSNGYAVVTVAPTLTGGTGQNPSAPGTVSTRAWAGPISATFPLGSQFFLQLTNGNQSGSAVPLQCTFQIMESSPQIPPSPDGITPLFVRNSLLQFAADPTTPSTIMYFEAVHLGTATVTITTTDASIPAAIAQTVNIAINQPASLGTTNTQFDGQILNYANMRGIPPEHLKGQVQQESNFNAMSWRYEPVSWDYSQISTGLNDVTVAPYSAFRLETMGGLAAGTQILPSDVAPRAAVRRCTQGVTLDWADPPTTKGYTTPPVPTCTNGASANMPASDTPPQHTYAKNILAANPKQNWQTASIAANWAAVQASNFTLLNFTAQTGLAASYGLLQVGYITAIGVMKWAQIDGAQNPSGLFDSDENWTNGGGSLTPGTGYLAKKFFSERANPGLNPSNPVFGAPDDFASAFIRAFNVYNHNKPGGVYGQNVVNTYAPQYMPVPSAPIFPSQ